MAQDPVRTAEGARKKPKQDRSRNTVDAILIAAAHILKTSGFSGVTTNAIAEKAGVSIGSLYQYFPNKHAILGELRARRSEWFGERLRAEIGRIRALPVAEAARGVVELLIALHAIDPLHNLLDDGGRPITPHEDAEFRELFRLYLIERADEVRSVDPEMASHIALRALEAVVHGTALEDPERLVRPEFADELVELLLRYLSRDFETEPR